GAPARGIASVASYAPGAAVGSSTTRPVTASSPGAAASPSTRVPQRGQKVAPGASGSSHTRQRSAPFDTSGTERQTGRDCLVVRPVGELSREAQRVLRPARAVAGGAG